MGGASLLAVQSARLLHERGHRVTFVTGDGGNAALDEAGIETVALGQDRLLTSNPARAMVRGLYNHKAHAMLRNWLAARDTPGTVYHLHGWSQILSPSIFKALSPVKNRMLMSAHDFFVTCPNGAMFNFTSGKPCPLTPMSRKCFQSNCDRRNRVHKVWRFARHAVLGHLRDIEFPRQLLIHEKMANYFARSGARKHDMETLPNPIVPYSDERIPAEKNSKALFVGRIEKTKGIDLAAAACHQTGVTLMAVGDGALLTELKSQYPEHQWLGRIPHSDIGTVAQEARMLLMPSLHMEPFGLSALEAAWSGLPVILSDHSLIADDLVNSGAGIAVDIASQSALTQAVSALAKNDTLTREVSTAAFHNTRELAMTMPKWIDALVEAYGDILGSAEQKFFSSPQPNASTATDRLTGISAACPKPVTLQNTRSS